MPLANNLNQISWSLLLFVVLIVSALFFLQSHADLNLADEGFLWYGSQRLLHGEFPLIDYMSYDPGRYVWTASIMYVTGNEGIVSVRVALAIFQIFALYLSLVLITRPNSSYLTLFSLVAVSVLIVWMIPRHKMFDIAVSIAIIYSLALLAEKPISSRFIGAGITVGLAAYFGRNHGLYGLIGASGLFIYLAVGIERMFVLPMLKFYFLGIIVGYSPMLLSFLFVPSFFEAFRESIIRHFELGTTNVSLPIPWPGKLLTSSLGLFEVKQALIGVFFLAVMSFGVLGSLFGLYCKAKSIKIAPAFIAAAFVSIPYAHFAFSRADVQHIAQSIFPFLIGVIILTSSLPKPSKNIGIISLLLASSAVALELQPGWTCYYHGSCVQRQVAGDTLEIDKGTAAELSMFDELVAKYGVDNTVFAALPHWPGVYAAHQSKSPTWEIYSLFPASRELQQLEIERLEEADPLIVVIKNSEIDDRADRRYPVTHPMIYSYIQSNFKQLTSNTDNDRYEVYVRHPVDNM